MAKTTVSKADTLNDFEGPFLIEGTPWRISGHLYEARCFVDVSFVNGARLAVFQDPGGSALGVTPEGQKVWTPVMDSANIALQLDSTLWEVYKKATRSTNSRSAFIEITDPKFITSLSRANNLYLLVDGKYESGFSLLGSSKALTSLGHCVDNQLLTAQASTHAHQSLMGNPRRSSVDVVDKLREFFRK